MTEPRTVRVVCPECEKGGWVSILYRQDTVDDEDCALCDGAVEFPATLLPLADGQMCVVDKEAWQRAIGEVAKGMPKGSGKGVCFVDIGELAECRLAHILTALFPAGIEVAEAVGEVEMRRYSEFTHDSLENPFVGDKDITGRRVALLPEAKNGPDSHYAASHKVPADDAKSQGNSGRED